MLKQSFRTQKSIKPTVIRYCKSNSNENSENYQINVSIICELCGYSVSNNDLFYKERQSNSSDQIYIDNFDRDIKQSDIPSPIAAVEICNCLHKVGETGSNTVLYLPFTSEKSKPVHDNSKLECINTKTKRNMGNAKTKQHMEEFIGPNNERLNAFPTDVDARTSQNSNIKSCDSTEQSSSNVEEDLTCVTSNSLGKEVCLLDNCLNVPSLVISDLSINTGSLEFDDKSDFYLHSDITADERKNKMTSEKYYISGTNSCGLQMNEPIEKIMLRSSPSCDSAYSSDSRATSIDGAVSSINDQFVGESIPTVHELKEPYYPAHQSNLLSARSSSSSSASTSPGQSPGRQRCERTNQNLCVMGDVTLERKLSSSSTNSSFR